MRPNLAQEMYAYAIPRRHTRPVDCAYEIVPRFKCNRLNIERVSELNSISTAWCVAENIIAFSAMRNLFGVSIRPKDF